MSNTQVRYGAGWITVVDAVSPDISITATLEAIRESPWQAIQEPEFGRLELGPSGNPPGSLLALDGATQPPLSPQLSEFYSYASWWHNSYILLEVLDPAAFVDLITALNSDLLATINRDYVWPGLLTDKSGKGLAPTSCVLFSVDHLQATYSRTYLVCDPPANSRHRSDTWGTGSLVVRRGRRPLPRSAVLSGALGSDLAAVRSAT